MEHGLLDPENILRPERDIDLSVVSETWSYLPLGKVTSFYVFADVEKMSTEEPECKFL